MKYYRTKFSAMYISFYNNDDNKLGFYFKCKHVLFADFKKMSWIFKIFKNLMKIEFCSRQIFENSIIHKPSLGFRQVPQQILGRHGSAVFMHIRQAKYIKMNLKTYCPQKWYLCTVVQLNLSLYLLCVHNLKYI